MSPATTSTAETSSFSSFFLTCCTPSTKPTGSSAELATFTQTWGCRSVWTTSCCSRDLGDCEFSSVNLRQPANSSGRTVQFHPDKLNNPTPQQYAAAEAFYIHLKNARDTLLDPAKRYAYERFGPSVLEWKDCITKLDFFNAGLKSIIPFYAGSLFVLVFTGIFRYLETGKYVRSPRHSSVSSRANAPGSGSTLA